ncbi:hypothetical protein B0H11DRAFT_2189517 [Mycena galericulata]|nr:hypothetical protein B0H11DRAFT_1909122 [Mycena galericulata]KAJ7500155.1 hypothetical protein B0H11DRAFT_2189515 [Mycena galericulata]KAJ7500160.1 hypothetical protein B0H11DRAFT_2189517 [Mycena galericulata]
MPKLIPFSEVGFWRATREHNGWRLEGNAHSVWPRVSDASRRLRGYASMSLAVRIFMYVVVSASTTSMSTAGKDQWRTTHVRRAYFEELVDGERMWWALVHYVRHFLLNPPTRRQIPLERTEPTCSLSESALRV